MSTEQTIGLTVEQMVQRVYDVHQCENVMGRHVWFHAAAKHHEELDAIWVKKTPDPHFAQNQGYYIGMESLRHYYGDINLVMQRKQLEALNKRYPDLEVTEENMGAGLFQIHPLTTQIIEVAEDGETAKGIWYSPGAVGGANMEGEVGMLWMWERYAVDFAKEDGEWKIWHLHTYTDFGTPVGTSWVDSTTDSMVGTGLGGGEDDNPMAAFGLPKPDREVVEYHAYSFRRPPQMLPRMPEPYRTFSETFSY
jgi:hypothetical protein